MYKQVRHNSCKKFIRKESADRLLLGLFNYSKIILEVYYNERLKKIVILIINIKRIRNCISQRLRFKINIIFIGL